MEHLKKSMALASQRGVARFGENTETRTDNLGRLRPIGAFQEDSVDGS